MSSAADPLLEGRLRHMQRLATGLLLAMAAVFVVTSFYRSDYPALDIAWAFSEAALIGGLADWFAVTALFRHPLGLPVPHTAIVPSRKNEIGRALARFISEHFLIRDVVEPRLARIDLAAKLGHWMHRADNAERLGRDLSVALDWLMRAVDSAELRESLKTSLGDAMRRVPVTSALGTLVDVLASGNHSQALIDQLVQFGKDQLERNKDEIRTRIKARSPWWLPKFVDEEIYDQLVGEFERILADVGENPAHAARTEFNARLGQLKISLMSDSDFMAKGEALRDEFLNHPDVRAFGRALWQKLREFVSESLADADSRLRKGFDAEIRAIGKTLATEPEVATRLNTWLRDAIVYVVENYADQLSEIVSDTIEQWDSASTSRRIELHIGRDLQFIRINGTLVGGLVGVVLYLGWQALAL